MWFVFFLWTKAYTDITGTIFFILQIERTYISLSITYSNFVLWIVGMLYTIQSYPQRVLWVNLYLNLNLYIYIEESVLCTFVRTNGSKRIKELLSH